MILASGGLFNNPLLFTLLIVAFILIVSGVALYFLVFKQAIKRKISKAKQRKEEREKEADKNASIASSILGKRDEIRESNLKTEADVQREIKRMQAEYKKNEISQQNFMGQIKNAPLQAAKPIESDVYENDLIKDNSFDVYNQFGGRGIAEPAKPVEADVDEGDFNNDGFSVFAQFNQKSKEDILTAPITKKENSSTTKASAKTPSKTPAKKSTKSTK